MNAIFLNNNDTTRAIFIYLMCYIGHIGVYARIVLMEIENFFQHCFSELNAYHAYVNVHSSHIE